MIKNGSNNTGVAVLHNKTWYERLTLQNITWYQHMHSADQVHTQVIVIHPSYNQGLTMEVLPVFLFRLQPRLR